MHIEQTQYQDSLYVLFTMSNTFFYLQISSFLDHAVAIWRSIELFYQTCIIGSSDFFYQLNLFPQSPMIVPLPRVILIQIWNQ